MATDAVEFVLDNQRWWKPSATTALYISMVLLTYDMVSDIFLGLQVNQIHAVASLGAYYECQRVGLDWCSLHSNITEFGCQLDEDFCSCADYYAVYKHFGGVDFLSSFLSNAEPHCTGLPLPSRYNQSIYDSYYSFEAEALDACGCAEKYPSTRPLVIAGFTWSLVAIMALREFIRVSLILYNLITTSSFDQVKHPKWIAESPFLILFRIFHPIKWEEMARLKQTNDKFSSSYAMLVNLFTEDLLAIGLDVAIIAEPLLNGTIAGEGNASRGIAMASLVASAATICYNTYLIRSNSSTITNGEHHESRHVRESTLRHIPNHKFQLLTVLVSSADICSDLLLALALVVAEFVGIGATLLILISFRELLRLMATLRNTLSVGDKIICPDMVVASPVPYMFFFIFKPHYFNQLLEMEKIPNMRQMALNLLTEDLLSIGVCIAVLSNPEHTHALLRDEGSLFPVYFALSSSIAVMVLYALRICQTWKAPPSPNLSSGTQPRSLNVDSRHLLQLLTSLVLMVNIGSDIMLVHFVPPDSTANAPAATLYILLILRECVRTLVIFQNLFSACQKIIWPGMLASSPIPYCYFFIFKPDFFYQLLDISIIETVPNWRHIMFNFLTEDVLSLVACIAVLSNPSHKMEMEDNGSLIVIYLSLFSTVSVVLLYAFRILRSCIAMRRNSGNSAGQGAGIIIEREPEEPDIEVPQFPDKETSKRGRGIDSPGAVLRVSCRSEGTLLDPAAKQDTTALNLQRRPTI